MVLLYTACEQSYENARCLNMLRGDRIGGSEAAPMR